MSSSKQTVLENLVLEAAANDFENIASITPDVTTWASSEKLKISDADIAQTIEGLVKSGKLSVYKFSKSTNRYETATFSKGDISNLWFRAIRVK